MKFINCSIGELTRLLRNRKLICVGAGYVLEEFFSLYHIENKVLAVADNNSVRIGTQIKLGEKFFSIIAVDQVSNYKDYIIMITCADIGAVYTQLEKLDCLDDVVCVAASYIRSETNAYNDNKRIYPSSFRLTEDAVIPKKIHYCWFGRNPLPEKNRIWMESWKKYCPDYELVEWNEDNYDITKNAHMYEAYKANMWGYVVDYARLDIIYEHGGIYLDTDVELIKCLDDLLYQPAFAGVDYSNLISLGLGFGAKKHCSIIKEMRDYYESLKFMNVDGSYNMLSQALVHKPFFEQKGFVSNGEYQIIDNILTIYPEKVLSAKDILTGRIVPTDHTYSIHHYDLSSRSTEFLEMMKKRISFFENILS